jgi:hypothetical protein
VALTGLRQERVPAKSSGVGIQLPFWPVWLAGHVNRARDRAAEFLQIEQVRN